MASSTSTPSETHLPGNSRIAGIGFWLGLILFMVFFVLPPGEGGDPLPVEARRVAAVAALCAVWWVSQALPLPVTALLPEAIDELPLSRTSIVVLYSPLSMGLAL